jgi:hypothetical protein
MADTFTTATNLRKPANNDPSWDTLLNANFDLLDTIVAPLVVATTAVPSTTLTVKVSAGSFRKSDGTIVDYAGTSSQALTASATNYLYLTDAGVLTVNTTGWPASTFHVRLAIATTNVTTVTAIAYPRVLAASSGAADPAGTVTSVGLTVPGVIFVSPVSGTPITTSGTFALALATQTANRIFAGPTSGGVATPTFRALVVADLPTQGLVVDSSSGAITADVDGATITFNCVTSNKHSVTLGGNRTLALSGDVVGQEVTLILKQDATGSRTVTWFAGILWPGGSAPTLTTTAAKTDVFRILKTGAGAYLGFILGTNL